MASQYLSDLCPIPALFAKIAAFYAKVSALYAKIPAFYSDISLFGSHCAGNVRGQVPVGFLRSVANDDVRTMRRRGGRAGARWFFFCVSVRAKLFWHTIYCAKPRPDPKSHSGSRSRRGLGRRDPQITREYELVTAIAIRPLTHPHTWEMGSSSFLPWVNSNSRVRLEPPYRACHPLRGKTKKNVSVARGSA